MEEAKELDDCCNGIENMTLHSEEKPGVHIASAPRENRRRRRTFTFAFSSRRKKKGGSSSDPDTEHDGSQSAYKQSFN